jgi:hypothetical protein
MQHAKHMCCVVTCGLSGLTIIFHVIMNGTIFGEKLLDVKCAFCFSLQLLLKHFSFREETEGV